MEEVVAEPGVGHRRLRRQGLKRRMRLQQRDGSQPSGVRDAENPHAPVVVLDVFDQPVDRVVSIRSLVYGLLVAPVARRAIHSELAFGPEFPANVLKGEDVTVRYQLLVSRGQLPGDPRSGAVWGA